MYLPKNQRNSLYSKKIEDRGKRRAKINEATRTKHTYVHKFTIQQVKQTSNITTIIS